MHHTPHTYAPHTHHTHPLYTHIAHTSHITHIMHTTDTTHTPHTLHTHHTHTTHTLHINTVRIHTLTHCIHIHSYHTHTQHTLHIHCIYTPHTTCILTTHRVNLQLSYHHQFLSTFLSPGAEICFHAHFQELIFSLFLGSQTAQNSSFYLTWLRRTARQCSLAQHCNPAVIS